MSSHLVEKQRFDSLRNDSNEISKLYFWLIPLLAWVFVTLILVFLQLLLEHFWSWWGIIGSSIILCGLGQSVGLLSYFFFRSRTSGVQIAVPYLSPDEFTDYCVETKRKNKHHPLNLMLYEGNRKIELMRSAGDADVSGTSTEIYVRKFYDLNILNTDFWYAFARVDQPDTLSWASLDYEPSAEEEITFIENYAQNLARTPAKYRQTKIVQSSPLTGVEQTTVTREPVATHVEKPHFDANKEELEENE